LKTTQICIDIISVCAYNYIVMYSVQEAAKLIRISESHLRLLLKGGEIRGKRLGRDWVVLELDYQRKRKPKEKRK
jgi:excisionase family DNA binding protein